MAQGLVPVRYKSGAPYNGAANVYSVAAGESNNIFVGDPVIISGTGDANGVPGVARAGAGDRITGVVVGFTTKEAADAGDTTAINRGYRAASEADYLLVADDPALLFEATEDGTGGFLATTDIGLNVDVAVGTGSTTTKKSGYVLDSSTAATTAAQLRIVGLSPRVNNTIGTTSTVWQVSIVEATETPAAGTTGV
tara:strand:- start:8219 stop:8803 length:585 start_codon:yes stop_codon:yes gene_type:complete